MNSKPCIRTLNALLVVGLAFGLLPTWSLGDDNPEARTRVFLPTGQGVLAFERESPVAPRPAAPSPVAPSPAAALPPSLTAMARPLVEWILEGPTAEEAAAGVRAAFPSGSRLHGLDFDPQTQFLTLRVEVPEHFLADPLLVSGSHNWITLSVIRTLQHLPIRGWEVLLGAPGTGEFAPMDDYLPHDASPLYVPTPDTAVAPKSATLEAPALETFAKHPIVGSGRPAGGMTGQAVYLNPGHGWVYGTSGGGDYWRLQRAFVFNNYEDHSNVDMVNQYLFAYCYNAGADVFSVRELDPNPRMVIVDNDDGNDGTKGYFETGPNWINSSLAGFANGHIPYASGQNPFSYGTNRMTTCVVGTPTHSATWIPEIPESNWYNVYVSHSAFTNRSPQAHYRIHHAGGETDYFLDQRRRRFTWIFIGRYYFEAGVNPEHAKVVLYNSSTSAEHNVSADAVRFGGGMGLIARGGPGVSGRPRFDEDSRYNTQFAGAPTTVYDRSTHDEADGWSGRPRFGLWLKQAAEAYGAPAQDSSFISSHTNAGGGQGLSTYIHTTAAGTWHDTFRDFIHDEVYKVINQGYSTSFVNRRKNYGSHGESNPTNVGNEMPIILGEWLFHDHAGDMAFYHDPEFRRMMARGVYQGIVRFWADRKGTTAQFLPDPPRHFRLKQLSPTSVRLEWDAPHTVASRITGDPATGYKVYRSTHGRGFPAGTTVAGTSYTVTGLTPGTTVYFRVSATNAGGESFPTPVLAVKTSTDAQARRILLVHAFDKMDYATRLRESHASSILYRQIFHRMNNMDQVVDHARAIEAYTEAVLFDSCQAKAIDPGAVALDEYDAVVWIGGIQAEVNTADPTNDTAFTTTQRTRLTSFLDGGGSLFVSSSRAAWDIDRAGGTNFIRTGLRISYAGASEANWANGTPGSVFAGLNAIPFGDGGAGTYALYEQDILAPLGSAVAALRYDDSGGGLVDGFETLGGWRHPTFSGSTRADPASTFSIVDTPVRSGLGAARLYYVWGADGHFIRVYNSDLPEIDADSNLSMWVYGDNSGNEVRLCVRDSDGDLFVNPYMTIDFNGWRKMEWNDIRNNPGTRWAGAGDGVVTGPKVRLDSIQLNKVAANATGTVYFDDIFSEPVDDTVDPSGPIAGIQYADDTTRLLYTAFPFETITDMEKREDLMIRALDFLLPPIPEDGFTGWYLR